MNNRENAMSLIHEALSYDTEISRLKNQQYRAITALIKDIAKGKDGNPNGEVDLGDEYSDILFDFYNGKCLDVNAVKVDKDNTLLLYIVSEEDWAVWDDDCEVNMETLIDALCNVIENN